jgi:hypothetical protein
MRFAPSLPARAGRAVQPAELARRVLARLGDGSAVRAIEIGAPPPRSMTKGAFPGKRPLRDGVWAYISAPDASVLQARNTTPEQKRAAQLARWEAALVGGALRDEFCSAGGPPLVGWTLSREVIEGGVSDQTYALNQRFPNPSPQKFRARVRDVGKRYGFEPVSIRFLRPRQLAPIVVVETDRDRRAFIAEVAQIMALLNPRSSNRIQTAVTFEGFFFEARDSNGPFVRLTSSFRGEVAGGQWSAIPDAYPYPHG